MQQPAPGSQTIDVSLLREALAQSQIRFSLLKERYPRLRGWLVLSNPTGQSDIGGDWVVMLGAFPGLFHDTPAKTSALALLGTVGDLNDPERKRKLDARMENCGTERPSITILTSSTCQRHPAGPHRGKHEVAL